jgi:excisionase family DNA binding protein
MRTHNGHVAKDNEKREATQDDVLTVDGLATLLKVPTSTVYAWRYRRTGPRGIRVGKHLRFRRSDVESWLETRADPQR